MKTKVSHWRRTKDDYLAMPSHILKSLGRLQEVDPCGGFTVVEITDGSERATGIAVCSDRDNYSKKIGRMIATGRAMKQLQRDPKFPLRRIMEVSGKGA